MQPVKKSLSIFYAFFILALSSNLMAQWQKQDFPSDEYLWKVRFANENVGWILGQKHIYKTDDGGLNWAAQDTSLGASEALYVLNDQTVFFANFTGLFNNWQRGIRRTTDGGLHWETVDELPFFYTDFEFVSDQVGFAVGIDENNVNAVRRTTDGGATWNTVSTNFLQTGYELQGITFVDALQGWIVSYDGYIYHTGDGGTNWALQDSIRGAVAGLPVRDICFVTADSGWAVGGLSGSRLVARTTDGGENWSVDIEGGASLREVTFFNGRTGFFAGNQEIAKTTDGGVDWEAQTPEQPNSWVVESISMINENTGWAVGYGVYKMGGLSDISRETPVGELPERFVLEQNYPNPFNPVTAIGYSIPAAGYVTLSVYNVTGQRVATLINKPQAAGTYEVAFNGSQLSGGIYFYRITSGAFSQIRKMVLLK